MNLLIVLLRIGLSAVFGVAGITKLLDQRGTRDAVKNFGAPESLAPVLGIALPIAEIAIAICSLVSGRMDLEARSTYASVPAAEMESSMVSANPKEVSASPNSPAPIDFSTQVKPIFEKKCQPCHFSGGQVYQKMPFDRPETIKTLGTKLFTRIKDENDRRVISDFLAQ